MVSMIKFDNDASILSLFVGYCGQDPRALVAAGCFRRMAVKSRRFSDLWWELAKIYRGGPLCLLT